MDSKNLRDRGACVGWEPGKAVAEGNFEFCRPVLTPHQWRGEDLRSVSPCWAHLLDFNWWRHFRIKTFFSKHLFFDSTSETCYTCKYLRLLQPAELFSLQLLPVKACIILVFFFRLYHFPPTAFNSYWLSTKWHFSSLESSTVSILRLCHCWSQLPSFWLINCLQHVQIGIIVASTNPIS